jgi:hypothetical protein
MKSNQNLKLEELKMMETKMDVFTNIVNEHARSGRDTQDKKLVKTHIKGVATPTVVALALLIASIAGLVHRGLAIPVMVIALMVACFRLGQISVIHRRDK